MKLVNEVVEVSDSEDERMKRRKGKEKARCPSPEEVIEISSDEEDGEIAPRAVSSTKSPPEECGAVSSFRHSPRRAPRIPGNHPSKGEIIPDSQVIDISSSDSSDDDSGGNDTLRFAKLPVTSSDGDDFDPENCATLVLNDPPAARKPLKVKRLGEIVESSAEDIGVRRFKQRKPNEVDISLVKGSLPPSTPKSGETSLPSTPRKTPSKARKPGKAATAAADLERRKAYAKEVFSNLNRTVFKNGLPANTGLVWNKRLLTTAGRAQWHKSSSDVHTTHIELAEKILDCDERIRNTLAHEMCHLAAWIIDQQPTESHGAYFKAWAKRVMKSRPDIAVNTRHNYEINYPYHWKCEKCSNIYGRFSKSIDTEGSVCGLCKEGKLIPQFETRPRTARTKATSRMAAIQTPDSPHSILRNNTDQGVERLIQGLGEINLSD